MASLQVFTITSKPFLTSKNTTLPHKHFRGRIESSTNLRSSVANVATQPPFWCSESDHKLSAWRSIKQEQWEGELQVHGQIPKWLNGTYVRNGPGLWNIGNHHFRHLFDGYSTVVGIHFNHGRVSMNHRQLQSDAYKAAKKNNRLCYREFSEIPDGNFLQQFREVANLFSGASITDNACTGVVLLGDGRVLCLTETMKGSILIDPDTLETLGRFEYSDNLTGLIHTSHPIVTDTELWTLLPDLFRAGYVVARMEPGTNKRKAIGRVECGGGPTPGWVHSFPVTENYIVVPEMPLRYSFRNLFRAGETELYKFEWHPQSKAYFHIVDKVTGNTVTTVEVPLFMTFHFINAYEEKDEEGRVRAVIADCCEHNGNTSIMQALLFENLRSNKTRNNLPDARIGRFRIPLDGSRYGSLESALDPDIHEKGVDMCTINPNFLGKKYRYTFGLGAHRPCNFPTVITKFDLVEKKAKKWYNEGCVVSEPFFVARPGATEEDDGIVIAMVSEEDGEGYAVLLDGSTFDEIARAQFPYGLPFGLHGCWVPTS